VLGGLLDVDFGVWGIWTGVGFWVFGVLRVWLLWGVIVWDFVLGLFWGVCGGVCCGGVCGVCVLCLVGVIVC